MHSSLSALILVASTVAVARAAQSRALRLLHAGGDARGHHSRNVWGSTAFRNPSAAVYGEKDAEYPENAKQSVELGRFITAYRTGMEKLIDVTPYSPLLHAAMKANDPLHVYTFIDTWVSNETGYDELYMDNFTHKCMRVAQSDGNGWSVSASLVFWPSTIPDSSTKPFSSLTLASGVYGSQYRIGDIVVHEGHVAQGGNDVLLDEAVALDLDTTIDASVYPCDGGLNDLRRPAALAYFAQQAEFTLQSEGWQALKDFEAELAMSFASEGLVQLEVRKSNQTTRKVWASFDPKEAQPTVGAPVFYSGVFTPQQYDKGLWLNMSYPLESIGKVTAVANGVATIRLDHPCVPTGPKLDLPELLIFSNDTVLPQAKSLAHSIVSVGREAAEMKDSKAANLFGPMQRPASPQTRTGSSVPLLLTDQFNQTDGLDTLGDGRFASAHRVGRLRLEPGAGHHGLLASASASKHKRVCIVQQKRHGVFFERRVSTPEVGKGGAIVLQLAVTGHGWAETTAQCGEFCHAVYRIRFNGVSAVNVTQWRDDCKDNPIDGELQHGTWFESRNGWCPGSIEPGVFIDVTDWLADGKENAISMDVVVWNDLLMTYEAYTDYGGFALDDAASLVVGLNLFMYEASAVATIRAQPKPLTAVEAAIHSPSGTSNPSALKPPSAVLSPQLAALFRSPHRQKRWRPKTRLPRDFRQKHDPGRRELEARMFQRWKAGNASAMASDDEHDAVGYSPRYDFEARAPWYGYSAWKHGQPGASAGAKSVQLFSHALVQADSRTIYESVPSSELPEDWSQVALHLKLSEPAGLEYDHWDRLASIGLLFQKSTEDLLLMPHSDSTATHRWWPVDVGV